MSSDDQAMIEALLASYDNALSAVQAGVAEVTQLSPTGRLKTTHTMREKLQRGTRLSAMQDVAGVRVTIPSESSRLVQDSVVRQIQHAFPDSRVRDRRDSPTHGYRAVHVIVDEDNCPVEIQVRTHLQDLWAQVVERLADLWGRGIRYGEPPEDPTARIGSGDDAVTRQEVLAWIMDLSIEIDEYEEQVSSAEVTEGALADVDFDALDDEAMIIVDRFNEATALLKQGGERLRRTLEALRDALQSSANNEGTR